METSSRALGLLGTTRSTDNKLILPHALHITDETALHSSPRRSLYIPLPPPHHPPPPHLPPPAWRPLQGDRTQGKQILLQNLLLFCLQLHTQTEASAHLRDGLLEHLPSRGSHRLRRHLRIRPGRNSAHTWACDPLQPRFSSSLLVDGDLPRTGLVPSLVLLPPPVLAASLSHLTSDSPTPSSLPSVIVPFRCREGRRQHRSRRRCHDGRCSRRCQRFHVSPFVPNPGWMAFPLVAGVRWRRRPVEAKRLATRLMRLLWARGGVPARSEGREAPTPPLAPLQAHRPSRFGTAPGARAVVESLRGPAFALRVG